MPENEPESQPVLSPSPFVGPEQGEAKRRDGEDVKKSFREAAADLGKKKPPPRPKAPSEVAASGGADQQAAAVAAGQAVAKRKEQDGSVAVMPGNLEGLWKLADALSRAKILPRHLTDNGRADRETIKANVFWIIQCGAELDIPGCQAIMGIAIINDKPCVYGDLLIGKVRSSPLCRGIDEWIEGEGEEAVAYCTAKRLLPGGEIEEITRSFSWKEAAQVVQKTKYGEKKLIEKDTYQNYGPRMLQHRARAYCLRDLFSDVLKGIRSREEEEDQAFVSPGPAQIIEARPEPPVPEEAEKAAMDVVVEAVEPSDQEEMANLILSDLEGAINLEAIDVVWTNSQPLFEDLPQDLRALVLNNYDDLRAGLVQNPLAGG